MPTITVRFKDSETVAAIGYLRGPADPTRARPSAAAAVRKAILFAAEHGHGPRPTAPPELAPVLDAWAALCAWRGHNAVSTREALSNPCPDLEAALVAIGYPLACRSARTLAQTFRHLGQRPCPDGRQLCRVAGGGGGGRSAWYVAKVRTPVDPPAPASPSPRP